MEINNKTETQFSEEVTQLMLFFNSKEYEKAAEVLKLNPDLINKTQSGSWPKRLEALFLEAKGEDGSNISDTPVSKIWHDRQLSDWTPFEVFALTDPKALKVMIDHGCDANWRDSRHNNMLNLIDSNSNVLCIEMLAKAGADIENKNNMGECPLLAAIKADSSKCTYMLANLGADMDAVKSEIGRQGIDNYATAVFKSIEARREAMSAVENKSPKPQSH